jgi:hypothetical protein
MRLCIRVWKKKNDDDETFTYCINLEFSNVYDFVRWKNKETAYVRLTCMH